MATLAQLKSRVMDIVKDSYFRRTSVTRYLNASVADIAAGVSSTMGDFLTPPLPKLFTIAAVSTNISTAYVSMPTTFQRALVLAANESGTEIDIANSWIAFSEQNPLLNRSGSIYEVIELGGKLYYQGIPTTSEEITLQFYRAPVEMSSGTDEPDGIPTNYHESLLVNYTVYRVYEMFGEMEKAAHYEGLFKKALADLEISLPHDTRSLFLT